MSEQRYYRGQIYYVYPKERTGNEQEGGRPAVIVSNDVGNEFSNVVEVVYLTTREKKPLPTHVSIQSARYPSTALCEQIESVDKARIGNYINEVTQGELKGLECAMLISLEISCGLKGSKALETWRKMMESCDYGNEMKKPAERLEDSKEQGDLELQMKLTRLMAERDVYKKLYMELLKIWTV